MTTRHWAVTASVLLLCAAGCSGGSDSVPGGAAGSGGASINDGFTASVAQAASSTTETEEPSESLAALTPTSPENTEPADV